MPRASIDYMNARKAAQAATGGARSYKGKDYHPAPQYAPDSEADSMDIARNIIGEFSLWAELTRQALCTRLAIPQAATDDIPF